MSVITAPLDIKLRFARSIEQLNHGAFDEMLSRYADDVTILIASPQSGDPVRETMFYGRSGFLDCLFRYVATLSPMKVIDVLPDRPHGAVATISCRGGRTMTYEVEFNRDGLGSRVRISLA